MLINIFTCSVSHWQVYEDFLLLYRMIPKGGGGGGDWLFIGQVRSLYPSLPAW